MLRFTGSRIQFCDGAVWQELSPGVVSALSVSTPSPNLTKSGPVSFTASYDNVTSDATISLAPADISFSGAGATGCVAAVSAGTSTLSRTITVTGCAGTGSVSLSIAAGTAKSITGNLTGAAGPSAPFQADNSGPAAPTALALGAVPNAYMETPIVTFTAAVDSGGAATASHQARVVKVSDGVVAADWATITSGGKISGISPPLNVATQYRLEVRGTDSLGNVGTAYSSATWTTSDCVSGTQTWGAAGTYTLNVPSGCNVLTVKLWGAGGGTGSAGSSGGSGGYATALLTGVSGKTVTVAVGGGGGCNAGGSNGGANGGTGVGRCGGGGGGATTVSIDGAYVMAAAGGGGASAWSGNGMSQAGASSTTVATWLLNGVVGQNGWGDPYGGCNAGGGGGGGGGNGGNFNSCNDGSTASGSPGGYAGVNLIPVGGTSTALNTSEAQYNGTAGTPTRPGLAYFAW